MNNNTFEIKIKDKTITRLLGNPFGKEVFFNQVKTGINYQEKITIIFPEHVERLVSSFVQGFFEEIKRNIGINGIIDNVDIVSSIDGLKDEIVESLKTY